MKIKIAIFAFIVFLIPASVSAQDSGFGLGVNLSYPFGVSLKYWVGDNSAFDAGIGFPVYGYYHTGAANVSTHFDYLWHFFDLFPVPSGKLPLYVGPGLQLGFGNQFYFGVRGAVGVAYLFEDIPLDIFLELAPGVNFTPDVDFTFGAGTGARWYF